jgi:hypothetical protein
MYHDENVVPEIVKTEVLNPGEFQQGCETVLDPSAFSFRTQLGREDMILRKKPTALRRWQ